MPQERRRVAKACRTVQQARPRARHTPHSESRRADPAASCGRRSSGRLSSDRRRDQGSAVSRRGGATSAPCRAAAHAQQHAETALLAVVEALVERLGGIGELLQRRPRARPGRRRRAQPLDGVGPGLRRSRLARASRRGRHAVGTLLGEFADRGLDRRPVLLLLGGELQPGLERRDARVGERRQVFGGRQSALCSSARRRAAPRRAASVARRTRLEPAIVSAVAAARTVFHIGATSSVRVDDASRRPPRMRGQVKVRSDYGAYVHAECKETFSVEQAAHESAPRRSERRDQPIESETDAPAPSHRASGRRRARGSADAPRRPAAAAASRRPRPTTRDRSCAARCRRRSPRSRDWRAMSRNAASTGPQCGRCSAVRFNIALRRAMCVSFTVTPIELVAKRGRGLGLRRRNHHPQRERDCARERSLPHAINLSCLIAVPRAE